MVKKVIPRPSRFVDEIPDEYLTEIRMTGNRIKTIAIGSSTSPVIAKQGSNSGYKLGSRVRHAKFGEGTVLNLEGQGEHARIQVNFQDAGNKWLVISFAKLELVA